MVTDDMTTSKLFDSPRN